MFRLLKRAFKLALSAGYYCAEQFCFRPLRILAGRPAGRFTILTYHQVAENQAGAFARQLSMARRFGKLVFADWKHDGSRNRFVAFTFDDFLSEALQVAGGALSEARVPSTWFAVSSCLGGKVNWIRNSQHHNQAAAVGSATEMANLDPSLFRIGSHTVSHSPLSQLSTERVDAEVRASKTDLEASAGMQVTTLSLPYGEYRPSTLQQCFAAGYEHVFANVPVWDAFSCGGFLRGRVSVEPTDWPVEFWLKLRGGYDWLAIPGWLRSQAIPRLRACVHPAVSGSKIAVEA